MEDAGLSGFSEQLGVDGYGGGGMSGDPALAAELAGFSQRIGVEQEALSFLYNVPSNLRSTIVNNFDPSGTKDGNVLGRLQGYVKVMMRKNGMELHIPSAAAAAPPRAPREAARHQPQLMSVHPGDLPEAISTWVLSLGLGENAAGFLTGLAPEMQQSILQNFDAAGTKDGNVWGRLLGYVRGLWSRRLVLPEQATAMVRSLSDELQVKVILSFDATGSKDGNVAGRLMGFCQSLASRSGSGSLDAMPPSGLSMSVGGGGGGHVPGASLQPHRTRYDAALSSAGSGQGSVSAGTGGVTITHFAQSMGLDQNAVSFLQYLPVEVQTAIITTFDPSGTKDGNVWGRLFAFSRRLWAQHAGLDRGTLDQLKASAETDQINYIIDWTMQQGQPAPQMHRAAQPVYQQQGYQQHEMQQQHFQQPAFDRGAFGQAYDPAVADFVNRWGLDARAADFVQRLQEPIRSQCMRSFDGSSSKDGNVWGRLFGYIRQTWANSLGLDQEGQRFLKELPEEAQMICLTDFDPSGTKDGNVLGRLQGFARKACKQSGFSMPPQLTSGGGYGGHGGGGGGGGFSQGGSLALTVPGGPPPSSAAASPELAGSLDLSGFCERCGLDQDSFNWLSSLPEDVLSIVVTEFDPTGTKDGNVLGRLQGYVRLLNARAQRRRMGEDPHASAKRPRHY
mmetsp:Transcript_168756/g.542366  ORF Transcript_168756/g.542366 Transcript_168756/m.542366 type:complete len:675 (-) Transcript_168756:31-2055(-)